MKQSRTLRKGIVGIEAAIVLIAFVVVAAALAFVALNMGFYTTQRSKEVMAAGLAQASSALEVDGSILALTSNNEVTCMVIPIRVSAGQKEVDLTPRKATIAVWIMKNDGKGYAYTNLYSDDDQAENDPDSIQVVASDANNPFDIKNLCELAGQKKNGVAVVWGPGSNKDKVLGPGEKALVVINFDQIGADPGQEGGVNVESYDVVKAEIKPPIGSPLTIERTMPATLTNEVIDLG